MSLNKNEFEYLRLYAQKCDHRNMAPEASFDLASDLRAHKGRGGRMFEKQKQRSDKHVIDESQNQMERPRQDSFPGPKLFAPHPAPWKPPRTSGPFSGQLTEAELMDRINQNNAGNNPSLSTTRPRDQEEADDKFSDAERLQKLYRILHYVPPEDLSRIPPMKAPKVDLRSSSNVPAVYGRNFNRNAKGWCAVDGNLQETANPASRPMHLSGLLAVDMDYYPPDFSPEAQEALLYSNNKPRPKSWHSVSMEDIGLHDEVLAGDYNPRPKAWQSVYEEVDSPQGIVPFGDYNPRPKPWMFTESEDLSPRSEVHFGDYNPRPKAWRSKHRKSKDQMHFGDYNPRPKAWQSSQRKHFRVSPGHADRHSKMKFGDYNPRPKAWKSPDSENYGIHGKVRRGDYNPRPKAWRSAPEDDSSSTTSSYSSTEFSDDDDYSYGSTLYSRSSVPACDV